MVENDTVRLLRECDAGAKMGVESIDDVLGHVKSEGLMGVLKDCKNKHDSISSEIRDALHEYHDSGKDPAPIAKGMSWMKTNAKLAIEDGDATVADLITDGCNMGVKSLSRYLNKYQAADEGSKNIASRLIGIEEALAKDVRSYL